MSEQEIPVTRPAIAGLAAGFRDLAIMNDISPIEAPVENHGYAHEPHKTDLLMRAADGPLAMALGALYLHAGGIVRHASGWSVSCLPRWSAMGHDLRAMTVSIGSREAFWVELDDRTGRFTRLGLLIEESGHRSGADVFASELGLSVSESKDGVYLVATSPDAFALHEDAWRSALSVAGQRLERGPKRRGDWHNERLARLLSGATHRTVSDRARTTEDTDRVWEFERRYVETVVRRRVHQRSFRDALLRTTSPRRCRLCDVDQEELLEAAHIEADAKGGAASFDNALLLCANHHRAMDAGLFVWDRAARVARWRVAPI